MFRLCLGDFNDVTLACEKEGGQAVNHRKMQQFRTLVDKCGFVDLSFNGPRHTWCNKREPQQRVWEQLDGAFTNRGVHRSNSIDFLPNL